MQKRRRYFVIGLIILFVAYHFPEFFSAFWITAVFKIGFLPVAFAVAVWQGWKGLGGYGLQWHRGWWRNLLYGLLIGTAFFILAEAFAVLLSYDKLVAIDVPLKIIKRLPVILLMTFFPSIAEDILTRGYWYGHLKTQLSLPVFTFLSAGVFVLNHIWRLNDGASVLSYLFILGLALAWCLYFTRSLWLALGIHWGTNIAFEGISASLHTRTINNTAATWILAAVYALMCLLIFSMRKHFAHAGKTG